MAVSGDGRLAVSASHDGTLLVWNLHWRDHPHTLTDPSRIDSGSVEGIAVTGDGRLAVSASGKALKVWDLASGRHLRSLTDYLMA